ncbi:MAG: glycosyl hydrolase [Lachnospiraceae bacterium]|nr:glycosyl hydrolase [Lachnospiraceae bacterium]
MISCLAGCTAGGEAPQDPVSVVSPAGSPSKPVSDTPVSEEKEEALFENEACWVVYWDDEDISQKLSDRNFDTDTICIFEAYFDEDYDPVCNEKTTALFDMIKKLPQAADKNYYLTVVNDVVGPSGTEQKDTEVLYSVLKDPAKHAMDIVDLAKQGGYDGIEIDYEKIRKDMDLWDLFISFENELITLCDKEGLDLRVVLEPSTPASKLSFPEGPEYVVMCYNLFGYGTKPGPKADEEFLEGLVSDFEGLPGDTGYALANGGFDWDLTDDELVSLSDEEAGQLLSEHKAEALRDEASGVLHFTYDKEGADHEVWAADDETLDRWSRILSEKAGRKVKISLWRI